MGKSSTVVFARNGELFYARQGFRAIVTAYTAGPESTGKTKSHPAYGITRSGLRAKEGRTIAVDPTRIPLGTWVYVENLGIFRAEDTGGKIKGNRLDIYMESVKQAITFGVKSLNVYILDPLDV